MAIGMSVSDICNTRVISADKDTSIPDVARLMREHRVGCVVVTEEIKKGTLLPVGVITDRDLVLEITAIEANPRHLTAGDIVIRSVITVRENDDIRETQQRMRTHGIRRVPVVDATGALTGILSADDMIGLIARELQELAQLIAIERKRERDLLRLTFAAEEMANPGATGDHSP
jgi:CBS domain-containing protein